MSKETETMIKVINAEAFSLGEEAYASFNKLSTSLLSEYKSNLESAPTDAEKAAVLFAYSKFCFDLQNEMEKA